MINIKKIDSLKHILSAVIIGILFSGFAFAQSLPVLPEHLSNPFGKASKQLLTSAVDLQHLFSRYQYDLEAVYKSKLIPNIFVGNLPSDLNALPVHKKTSLFIRLLLTSVAKVNHSILKVRGEVENLAGKKQQGKKLSKNEITWLADIAADYYCSPEPFSELLLRVDILPAGLVLAQGIDESGWGTSHFARKGNALYGQHLGNHSKGTFLTTPGGHVKVATFDNLYHSTASYIHTINTTKTYSPLRQERAKVRTSDGILSGHTLAGALGNYSIRGQHYVKTLRWLISHYKLDELDKVQFKAEKSSILVVF
jgi:uncharacterized FlgJ-related protein